MNKQEPETRKSIYPPIEIKLDGEAFQSRKFTHPVLLEKAPHEKEIESDDEPKKDESDIEFSKRKWDAYCNWMRIVFATTDEKLEKTEFAEIEDAFMKVKVELLERSGNRMGKSVTAMKAVTDKIGKVTDTAIGIKDTAEEIAKNAQGSGEKK